VLRKGLVVTALALVLATGAGAEPRRPADPAEVLERLPPAARPVVADGTVRLEEARVWAQRAALTQDSRFAGYAQAALGPAWEAAEPIPQALVLRAVLKQHRHDFTGALDDLDRAIAQDPGDPQARLTRAGVRLATGDPAGSMADCRALRRMPVAAVAVVACEALAASRSGRAGLASVLLEGALGDGEEVPPELRAWSFTAMGEILAALGREDEAERWLLRALEAAPEDAYARQALADHWLATGRAERVPALMAGRVGNDGHRLRLALALLATGDPAADEHVAILRERYATSHARGEATAAREEARLLLALGDAASALPVAARNWRVQREPVDALILLEAARAAGRAEAARPVLDWIAATGIEDVRLAAGVAVLGEGS
jgi:tetratricopeptide (TPR) repeat protein